MAIDFNTTFGRNRRPERPSGTYIEFSIEDPADKASDGVRLRAATIFESFKAQDPKAFFKSSKGWRQSAVQKFDIAASSFLDNAARNAPSYSERSATVSGFASWVYSLYSKPDEEAQIRGKAAEKSVLKALRGGVLRNRNEPLTEEEKHAFLSRPNNQDLTAKRSPWELIHNGLHITEEVVTGSYFSIDHLRVNGKPLRASPDLLYRHQETGAAIVVEIKFSSSNIPLNLWPNVWAQLWCYAQIPPCQASNYVSVIGEVWDDDWNSEDHRSVIMRKSVRRDPRNPSFDRFFGALFDIYRGKA